VSDDYSGIMRRWRCTRVNARSSQRWADRAILGLHYEGPLFKPLVHKESIREMDRENFRHPNEKDHSPADIKGERARRVGINWNGKLIGSR